MDRVTADRNAYHDPMMDDEKSTRFAQWKSGLVAESHVLVKRVGDVVFATWAVTNTGGVTAEGFLELFFTITDPLPWVGTKVSIPPGATVTLDIGRTVPLMASGTYAARVRVAATAPATVAPGGVHNFTLTISPTGAAVLSAAAGGPTIT